MLTEITFVDPLRPPRLEIVPQVGILLGELGFGQIAVDQEACFVQQRIAILVRLDFIAA